MRKNGRNFSFMSSWFSSGLPALAFAISALTIFAQVLQYLVRWSFGCMVSLHRSQGLGFVQPFDFLLVLGFRFSFFLASIRSLISRAALS